VPSSSLYVYDLSVDEGESFTVVDGIITHNSMGMKHNSGAVMKIDGDKSKDITGTLPQLHNLVNLIDICNEDETPIRELGINDGGELFVQKMAQLYNSEGICPWEINFEMVWRGLTELCLNNGVYSLFRLTRDKKGRIILNINSVLKKYPSFLKPLAFGHI